VSLTGESFTPLGAGADVSCWLKNKPSGIAAKTTGAISAGGTEATLAISGTPEDASEAAIVLTIPADRLAGGEALTADRNPNAKWDIKGVPTEWYKPGMASTEEAYTNAGSWKASGPDALGGWVYEKGGELTQILPLAGQEVGVPADTPYEYRARAVTLKESGEVLYRSNWCNPRAVLAKGAGLRDVVENARGAAQILPNAVTLENLNVLAKNAVNNFVGGTKEGWETNGEIVEDAEEGLPVLEIPAPDAQTASNEFDVLPENIYEVKFGFRIIGAESDAGVIVGLIPGQTYRAFAYDAEAKGWKKKSRRGFLSSGITGRRRQNTPPIYSEALRISTTARRRGTRRPPFRCAL
jgi:hypothetical protein